MRVAALYDIHGNLPALEAVLRDVREAEVDIVVVAGDVLPGPMPSETLTRLFDLDVPAKFIMGNGEVAVLQEVAGKEPTGVPAQHRYEITWTAQQLDDARKSLIAAWPKTLRIDISGIGRVFFATPLRRTKMTYSPASHPRSASRGFLKELMQAWLCAGTLTCNSIEPSVVSEW